MELKKSYLNSSLVKLIEGLKDVEDQVLKELSNDTNSFYIGSNYNYHE